MALISEVLNPACREEFWSSRNILGYETLLELVFVGDRLGVCSENILNGNEFPDWKPVKRRLAKLFERRILISGEYHIVRIAKVKEWV